jgi:hypothetical protein
MGMTKIFSSLSFSFFFANSRQMKKPFLLIVTILFPFISIWAQYPYSSSTQNSGIINLDEYQGLNYEFTSSRLGFNFRKDTTFMDRPSEDPDGHADKRFIDFTVGAALNESTFALFEQNFKPGIDLGLTVASDQEVYTDDQKHQYRIKAVRLAYENKWVDFAFEDIPSQTVVKDDAVKHVLSLAFGLNWFQADQDKGIEHGISGSLSLGRKWNDEAGLSTREYCTYEANGVDKAGNPAFISNCKKVKFGELQDNWFIAPRIDVTRRIAALDADRADGETYHNPALYLLGTFLVEVVGDDVQPTFIGGLSMTQYSQNIIAALLFECNDFTSDKKSFEEIFAIKFYLGVPLVYKNMGERR